MTPPKHHAKFEYEQLGDFGAVVVLYLGLLSVLHKQVHGSADGNPPPFLTGRADFMEALGDLEEYFSGTQGSPPTQIRISNKKTQRRLARFLAEMHDRFAQSAGDRTPSVLRAFRERLLPDRGLAEQLSEFRIEQPGGRPPIQFPLIDPNQRDADVVGPIRRLAAAATAGRAKHPELPGIPAHNEFALATEFLGTVERPDDPAWKKTGLFSVIREARGPYTSEKRDINIIVRDVLWMRRCTGADPSGEAGENQSGNIGFYFSALDRTVYEIRKLTIRNGMMMLDAVSFMPKGDDRSLCMYYPESAHDHPLHCREGILMGTTRDERRAGAWKVLIIRPNWPDAAALEAKLSVYLRWFENQNRHQHAEAVFKFVTDAKLVGILYSREWARREPSPELDGTRINFRTMLWEKRALARREEIFVGNHVDAALRSALAPLLSKQTSRNGRVFGEIVDAVQKVLTDNWQLIEPPQIISSGYAPDSAKAGAMTKGDLEDFIRRERILDYDQYAERFKKTTRSAKSK